MISTPNLNLIPCELKHFEAILNDQNDLEQVLGVAVPANWFDFPGVSGIETIRLAYEHLKEHPEALGRWTYLIVQAKTKSSLVRVASRVRLMNLAWWKSDTQSFLTTAVVASPRKLPVDSWTLLSRIHQSTRWTHTRWQS